MQIVLPTACNKPGLSFCSFNIQTEKILFVWSAAHRKPGMCSHNFILAWKMCKKCRSTSCQSSVYLAKMLLENRKSSNIVAQSYYRTSFRQLHWCLTFAWLHWVASRDIKFSAMIDSLLLQAVKQSLVLIFCTFFCAASTSDHLSSSHLMR